MWRVLSLFLWGWMNLSVILVKDWECFKKIFDVATLKVGCDSQVWAYYKDFWFTYRVLSQKEWEYVKNHKDFIIGRPCIPT